MMQVNTFRFGTLNIEEKDIITFAQGIPGFEEWQKYILVQPDTEVPFCFLQSIDEEGLAFIVTDPFVFFSEYDFQLPVSIQEELSIESEKDVKVWSIVSVPESLEEATVNLMAPLVVNLKDMLGKQVILHDSGYRTRHSLLPSGDAGQAKEEK